MCLRIERFISKKWREEAQRFGGTDIDDWEKHVGRDLDNKQYYDDLNHLQRSSFHSPQHNKYLLKPEP